MYWILKLFFYARKCDLLPFLSHRSLRLFSWHVKMVFSSKNCEDRWTSAENRIGNQGTIEFSVLRRVFYFLSGRVPRRERVYGNSAVQENWPDKWADLRRSLSALNRAPYSVSIGAIESSSWLVGDRRLLRASWWSFIDQRGSLSFRR